MHAIARLTTVLLLSALPGLLGQNAFTKVTVGDIVTDVGCTFGCAWGDFDGDGWIDLFAANMWGQPNDLYRNNGDGTFTKITTGSVVTDGADSVCGVWADYDNDGDLDLFVTNFDPPAQDFFYRNNGNGTFTRVTEGAWVNDSGAGISAAWGDYDNDGFVDLVVGNDLRQTDFLYQNNGDGTMNQIVSGPIPTSGRNSMGCAWGDYDGDGDLDLAMGIGNGSPSPAFVVFGNDGQGNFAEVKGDLLHVVGSVGVGLAWADYDNSGALDLFVARNRGGTGGPASNLLFKDPSQESGSRVTEGAIVQDLEWSVGCAWGDFDNDGYLDLFVAAGGGESPNDPPEPNLLYRNNGNANAWLLVKLIGTVSNRSAIGAKVRARATIGGAEFWQLRGISGGSGYCSQNDLRAHFGLGDAAQVDILRIEWPSGMVQELKDVPVRQILTVTEPPRLVPQGAGGFKIQCWINQAFDVEASTDLAQLEMRTSFPQGDVRDPRERFPTEAGPNALRAC